MNYIKRIPLVTCRAARLTSVASLRGRRASLFTSGVRAAEPDDTFHNNFKSTSVFRKIADRPEALAALRDFAALMKEKGIDTTSGPPSTTQMIRLAASSDFRQAAQRVVAEMKDAGVDLSSQDVMQELMALSKKSEDS